MLNEYAEKLQSLAVFRGILKEKTTAKLLKFLISPTSGSYGDFVSGLYEHGDSLTDFLTEIVTEDENPYIKRISECREIPVKIDEAVRKELAFLQELSQLTSEEAWTAVGEGAPFARWSVHEADFLETYRERVSALHTRGFGIFAKYHAFPLRTDASSP